VRVRSALVLALAGVVLATSCSLVDGAGADRLTERVTVEQGPVVGTADGGVLRFQGLPFAAPPVGALRWRPPQPPAGWTEPREATAPGARCPQLAAAEGTPHATAASENEDCLTLNVTVPAGSTPGSRLPVLFWIHGGGFSAGAGSDVDPRRLAEAGPMVVVTTNYRLGMLGFLGLPGLPGSGSFGLLDQQQALRWVQRNIAAFGGDPARVTVAGESAGADSVCAQLSGSAGLFHRAILQSGGCSPANIIDVIRPGTGAGGDTWKPRQLVESAGRRVAQKLGCDEPDTVLDCLRELPVRELTRVTGTYWSPAVGTELLPERPSDLVAADRLPPVPLLAGTTRNEGALFTSIFFDQAGTPVTARSLRALLSAAAGPRAAAAGRAYRPGDRSPGRIWSEVITDRAYACPALAGYRALATRAPLFAYEFTDTSAPAAFAARPEDLADGATHGAELAYLFDPYPSDPYPSDAAPGRPALTPPQQALASALVGAWARFVVRGDPGGELVWPRWDGDGPILSIGSASQGMVPKPAAEFAAAHRCTLWEE
jgi:para-nitrobenzyl esterase